MALEYLLSPEFQISTTSGRPDTGGWIEVYLSGTRTKYFTSCDFNGTKNPFRVPLDSLGQAMMLADSGSSYDCYFYNRYGTLLFSRMNVTPSGGGAISSVTITSSDDSLTVTPTENGVDLSVNGHEASVLRAVGAAMTTDGRVSFTRVQKTGTAVDVSEQNKVMASSGWYHYDIVGKLTLAEATSNQTERVTFTTNNDTSVVDFDMTYAHTEAVHLSGEWLAENETTEFYVDVSGIPTGMTVSVEDLGIHAINGVVAGHGGGVTYTAGNGIDITDNEISVDTSVVATQTDLESKQDTLTAGENISILDNVISATAAPQVNADWDATSGVAEILNKPTIPVVPEMKELVAGTNVTITESASSVTISAAGSAQVNADWDATSGVAEILNKPTIPVLPAMKDLVAGSGIEITEGSSSVTISAVGASSYTAGTGIDITNDVISADTTVLALKSELHTIGTVTL